MFSLNLFVILKFLGASDLMKTCKYIEECTVLDTQKKIYISILLNTF